MLSKLFAFFNVKIKTEDNGFIYTFGLYMEQSNIYLNFSNFFD